MTPKRPHWEWAMGCGGPTDWKCWRWLPVIDPGTILDIPGIGECLCLDHDRSHIDVLARDGHTYLTRGPDEPREPHEAVVTPELTRGNREYLRRRIERGNFSPKRTTELLGSIESWFAPAVETVS